jgi:hypothetical protein
MLLCRLLHIGTRFVVDVKCWYCELLYAGEKADGNQRRREPEGVQTCVGSTRKSLVPELEAGAPRKSDADEENAVGVSKFRLSFERPKKIRRF